MNASIVVDETTGVDRHADLLLGGIPLARGELRQGGSFELRDEGGRTFPAEGTPAAWWPDGSVKWLHLCGLVDAAGGRRTAFDLAPCGPPPAGLRTARAGRAVTVTGGMLDITVAPDPDRTLAAARPGGPPLLKGPGLSAGMVLCGPEGTDRRPCALEWAGEGPAVVVETAARVVVRLPGRLVDAAGAPKAELILFVEVFRDLPEVRLQPVWIYLGRMNEDLVASLTLSAHVPLEADAGRYTFSQERGRGFEDVIRRYVDAATGERGPRWPEARLVQHGSTFHRIEKRASRENASWLKAAEGARAQGWCCAADETRAVTAAMRYFWQEYPHSLAIDCDAGAITFGLVPPEGPPLDLRRYSPQVYGGVVYESHGPGPFNTETHGPTGIAKAHELLLRFHDPRDPHIAERALWFTRPLRPLATPARFGSSRAIGRVAPADTCAAPEAEEKLAQIADFLVAEREVRGWYGLMDYGDIQIAYYSALDRWAYDDGGFAWLNTESLPDYGLWIAALRAARTDWLQAAIDMSRHNRDVDVYHSGPLRGLGSRHNVNHWGCMDKEWRISMPLARRLHYYVTADPWTVECIRDAVSVYQTYERTASVGPSTTSALAGILVKWELDGDPANRAALERFCGVYARCVRPDGQFVSRVHMNLATGEGHPVGDEPHASTFFMNTFGGQHVLVELAELLEHKQLSAALVRHAEFWVAQGKPRADVLAFLAHAWRATGDRRFLDAIRGGLAGIGQRLEEAGGDGVLETPRHLVIPGCTRKNKIACHPMGDNLHLAPYGLAALDQTGGR